MRTHRPAAVRRSRRGLRDRHDLSAAVRALSTEVNRLAAAGQLHDRQLSAARVAALDLILDLDRRSAIDGLSIEHLEPEVPGHR